MKILVVEDDRAIAQTLQLLLSSYDYAVDIASSGEAGLEMIDAFDYDLVLLDLILPKLDGISVCQQLRAKGLHIPILVLTGQEGQSTRLSSEKGCATALNAGADDYISKPFETKELMARVQALLRRREASNQPTLTWGHLSIDPGTRSVTYGDRLVPLTPKEYAILELFLHNPQKIFSSHAILDYVWNAVDSPGEESVRVHIKGVRHKLTEAGAPKDLIKTIHRVGYRLNPIYSSRLAVQTKQLTALQIAELKSVNEELRKTLEELYVTREELRQQNEQLEAAHRTIELERQQYRDLFELAPDAYIVTDMYGMIQAANQAASALFQIDVHDLVNQPLITWVAKSDRHTLHSQFTNLNTASSWEINIQPQEGEPLPVLVSITKIKDSQVGNTSLCWLLHDIRPRKAIEQQLQAAYNELEMRVAERTVELNAANQALQQQYNQWRSLFQHIQVAIAIADDEGQFVDANPSACQLFSLSQAELLHLNIANLTKPEFGMAQVWQQLMQQGRMTREFSLCCSNSTEQIVELTAIANFAPGQHLIIFQDISDSKLAEQKIREQAILLDIASDAIFVRDLSHRILYWNQGAERLYGWQASEAIGQLAHELFNNDIAQQAEIMNALKEQNEWRGESHQVTKTGLTVIVEAYWMLVRDEAGQPKFILEIDTDVTEKKQLEAQFYRAQRLESLGTLAREIAYDLNDTLTPILGIAQLLRLKEANVDARSHEMLQILEASAKRGANIVKQILTFTRGGEGQCIPLQVVPLMKEVAKVVQQTFPKSITIRELMPDQPLRLVFADPTYLHQVLMNLCVNARDAMPNGGTLTLSAQNYDVDEFFAQTNLEGQVGNYVLITVSDTGTGISPEIVDRVFEPFFTTKEPGHGTGLGLSAVLGIVKNYGGFLQISSEVGQGSHFKVYLPATEAPSSKLQPDQKYHKETEKGF